MVLAVCRRVLRDEADAEEAAQEVFLRAMKRSEQFESRAKASTWLYAIAKNYCLNKKRDRVRRAELMRQSCPPKSEERPINDETLMVKDLLSRADEQWAQAAVRVFALGMTHAEASADLGISRRSVGNYLVRFTGWARAA